MTNDSEEFRSPRKNRKENRCLKKNFVAAGDSEAAAGDSEAAAGESEAAAGESEAAAGESEAAAEDKDKTNRQRAERQGKGTNSGRVRG